MFPTFLKGKAMEAWVPLFDIFLNSPTPESEASLWLQQSFNASSTPTITTNSFVALLTKDAEVVAKTSGSQSSSRISDIKRFEISIIYRARSSLSFWHIVLIYQLAYCVNIPIGIPEILLASRVMWIETLPNMVQARILSFLAHNHRRFSCQDLSGLAKNLLLQEGVTNFWVRKAAHNLLDKLSELIRAGDRHNVIDVEFYSVPSWLKNEESDAGNDLILPWLPLSLDESRPEASPCILDDIDNEESVVIDSEDEEENPPEGNMNEVQEEYDNNVGSPYASPDADVKKTAVRLSSRLLNFESNSKAVALADEMRQLRLENSQDSLAILALIEPWKAEDETTAVLLSRLLSGSEKDEFGWPSQVLCSTVLPKLLVLEKPASRVLVTMTMDYCKRHQRAAEFALLLPLILRKDGINNPICDVITRIIK